MEYYTVYDPSGEMFEVPPFIAGKLIVDLGWTTNLNPQAPVFPETAPVEPTPEPVVEPAPVDPEPAN